MAGIQENTKKVSDCRTFSLSFSDGIEMRMCQIVKQSDIVVRGLRRCSGASFRRKQLEMQLIFRLGTMQPSGVNSVFHFL